MWWPKVARLHGASGVYALAIVSASLLAHPSYADDEADRFARCVLFYMRGVTSDTAAEAIKEACRRLAKRSPQEPACRPFTVEESGLVEARLTGSGEASTIRLYNGNRNISVRSLILRITFPDWERARLQNR